MNYDDKLNKTHTIGKICKKNKHVWWRYDLFSSVKYWQFYYRFD